MKIKFLFLLLLLFSSSAAAQMSETDRKWNQPVEPFKIIGNIYYVGAAEITSFLITSPKGHILLDGGFTETAPQIKQNIVKLGFRVEDVKVLLNSQAHYDHAGGLAEMKRATGARILASKEDAVLLENGGRSDFFFGDRFVYEPVKVEKKFNDGEIVKIGSTALKAVITPGHTKGCTTWTTTAIENGRKYNVIFVCSTTIPGYNLADTPNYPNIVQDYEKTFAILKKIPVDVFLASHGNFFHLAEKSEKAHKGTTPNPFIDPQRYKDFLELTEKAFRDTLESQTKAKGK